MNSLTIIGNVTRDPETHNTNNGKSVCNFTVAVNRRQKDENGNSIADFFRVAAWGKTGEICQKFLAKGRKVAVMGSVSASCYVPKDGGEPRGQLEVFAENVEFLSPKDEGGAAPAQAAPVAPAGGFMAVETDELPF